MKVTKYPQSCLILEKDNKRLAIDPGSLVSQKYKASDFWPLDGILITHEHADHADPELLRAMVSEAQIPVVANASAAKVLVGMVNKIVKDGESLEVAGFQIRARDLPHCRMVDGSEGPQNTGYVVDGNFFHPGDGLEISGLHVEAAATPIAGPDVSPRDIFNYVKSVGCRTVIPIHYDFFPADPKFIANMLAGMDGGLRIVTLDNGQSAEI